MTTVVNITKEKCDVYIGRWGKYPGVRHLNNTPIGQKGWLGNPYAVEIYGRTECIRLYQLDFMDRLSEPDFLEAVLAIRGKKLGCYCSPLACHGNIIANFLDNPDEFWGQNANVRT